MIDVEKLLREHDKLMADRGIPPNQLKAKYLGGKAFQSHPSSNNNSNHAGHSARRIPGWRKHGKGPANASR